jgi:hypothetical protein
MAIICNFEKNNSGIGPDSYGIQKAHSPFNVKIYDNYSRKRVEYRYKNHQRSDHY